MIQESLAWGGALAIGRSLIGGVRMSRKLIRQLDAINRTSRQIVAGDLSKRVPVSKKGDEFDD